MVPAPTRAHVAPAAAAGTCPPARRARACLPACLQRQEDVMDAVVKIYCTHTEPNYSLPWQRKRQYSSTSSGFVVAGEAGQRYLLTNAHSVEHYSQTKVKRRGDDRKWLATVLAIGTECDVALLTGAPAARRSRPPRPARVAAWPPMAGGPFPLPLRLVPGRRACSSRPLPLLLSPAAPAHTLSAATHPCPLLPPPSSLPAVDDEEFWQGVQPLRFGPLPNLQESVYVVGYPIGGDTVRRRPSCPRRAAPAHAHALRLDGRGAEPFAAVPAPPTPLPTCLPTCLPACLPACLPTFLPACLPHTQISVTSGVVSRIEVTAYAHGATELLGVQIDAAINSGNSGG